MKIVYVGNFTQAHCTEVHIAKTLESLGHAVVRLQENGYTPDELTNVLAQNQFNLFLFTRTWGDTVTLEHLAHLRERKIPSVSYHLDLYVGLSRKYLHLEKSLKEVLESDPFWRTDYVFTPDGDPKSQEFFEASGVHHYYMRPGVFEPECYIAEPEHGHERHDIEVLFVGGGDKVGSPNGYGHPEWPYRDKLITWLYDTYGERFTKFGHPQATIRNEELNQLYADSKVVVGDSVCIDYNHENYWSDRVYETIGRGGFLIHPFIKGLDDELVDKKHIVFYEYGNFDQLKDQIDYYLEHDEEREAIRLAGHEFVKKNCTYTQRMQQMLEFIGLTLNIAKQMDAQPPQVALPPAEPELIKINLGAGSEPTEGWVNVDWTQQDGIDVIHNLLEFPWPFEDGVANQIMARDVLEHMPLFNKDNQSTPIKFVEECHRLLSTGGKLFITVPHWQSKNLWIDPTHVRGYDEQSFDYFDPDKFLGQAYGYYSDKKFSVSAVRTENDNVEFTMVKL